MPQDPSRTCFLYGQPGHFWRTFPKKERTVVNMLCLHLDCVPAAKAVMGGYQVPWALRAVGYLPHINTDKSLVLTSSWNTSAIWRAQVTKAHPELLENGLLWPYTVKGRFHPWTCTIEDLGWRLHSWSKNYPEGVTRTRYPVLPSSSGLQPCTNVIFRGILGQPLKRFYTASCLSTGKLPF